MEDSINKIKAIQLDDKVVESISKNKKVVAKLGSIVDMAGGKAEKSQGNLLYALSTKLPPSMDKYTQSFVDCIMANKWARVNNIDEAISYVKAQLQSVGDEYKIDTAKFEEASGVGINVTENQI